MKKINILISLFLISFFSSQTNRFIYEVEYKENPNSENLTKTNMVLDINPNTVKYYDYDFLVKDSLNKKFNSQNSSWNDLTKITRNKNSQKNMNFVSIGDNIYSYETNDDIEWKIQNETKKIGNINTQKATSNFGGRKWTAWFDKDIPFNEGPYKFYGLPGLVIQIQDSENNFIFNLISSKNLSETYDTANVLEVRYGDKPISTTEKMVIKKALEYFENPIREDIESMKSGKIVSFEYNGQKYKAEELSGLIKEEQQYIIDYYNPIEKNKAIPYKLKK